MMSGSSRLIAVLIGTMLLSGCYELDIATLHPAYAAPLVPSRSTIPLAIVYSPIELPDTLRMLSPSGYDSGTVHGAQSLATVHLKQALESMFASVTVVTDPHNAPQGALLCWLRFVELSFTRSPGGTLVGALEWSLSLRRAGDPQPLYSWSERAVGSREGGAAFPDQPILGAIEASLRALLKDMETKNVIATVSAPPAAAGPAVPPTVTR